MIDILPGSWRAKLASTGLDKAWPVLALAVLVIAALAVSVGPATFIDDQPARQIEDVELPESALTGKLAVTDTDLDGLPDALENYVYGTDPENWDSSGTGVPDGYYTFFGYHPLDEGVAESPTATPPASALPEAYDGTWPDRYRLTVRGFYELTRPADYTPGQDEPWWKEEGVPSPAEWDKNGDGIADAWFVIARLDPYNTPLDQVAPGSEDTLTVRENWELGTNPSLADTDRDGIDDADEPALGTDPTRFSTLEAGVADGWLLAKGLDPLDPGVLFVDPDRDGLTTAEEFRESQALMPNATIQEIALHGLDPFSWDTSGDGIPDGWLVVNGLDPLDPTVGERVTDRASDYGPIRFLDEAPEGQEPLGDLELTVADEYAAARPDSWDESRDGVWWGGTSPATNDTDGDGLPDAIEVRGWYVELTLEKGPGAQSEWVRVTSDPSRADSDGDGLTDLEEYRGQTACSPEETRAFPPTHPGRSDSAFSGLTDHEKVCGFEIDGTWYDLGPFQDGGLDPTKADSDGDLIADGPEARYWHKRSRTVGDPYPFPDARFASTLDMASGFPAYAGASSQAIARALAPDGDWDGDGLPNLMDPDSSSALILEGEAVCEQGSPEAGTTFLLDGPQINPDLYRFTEFSSQNPRPPTDPANPDTDGDGLPDAWEIRFARFIQEQNRWSLDPTLLASSGGTNDGQANFDDDVIEYFAPPDQVNKYVHDNLQECRSGTDPSLLSTEDDGVSDGWKVFWGLRYVDLVSSNDPLVGKLTEEERSTVLTRAGQISIGPGQALEGTPPWWADRFPVPYTRWVPLGDDVCAQKASLVNEAIGEVDLADWERIPADAAQEAPCVVTAEEVSRLLLPVRGSFNATFSALFGTGANPYLDDADRDGAEDWWEVLHARIPDNAAGNAPSPLAADGDADLDGDGLTLAEEFETWVTAIAEGNPLGGADPRLVDSDFDGLSDADEVLAGFDPKDPHTIERLGAEGGDADGDGIADLDEIKGWSHQQPPPLFKTSPINPDTDGDGLVDNLVEPGPRREDLDRIGIAHLTRDGETTYLGEGLYRSDPTKLDTSGDGVPDGWQAYYQERTGSPGPTTSAPGLLASYEAGRPIWWDEVSHGVWWWGMPPAPHVCGDLDGDGLSDTNGEDPFPARDDNTYRHGTFETDDPEQAKAYILGAPSASAARERAQAWGPNAGDPFPGREHLVDGCPSTQRPAMSLQDLTLVPEPPLLGGQLKVTGRVVDPSGAPVPSATVLVSTLRPSVDRAVGAAFTGQDGAFTIDTQVRSEQTAVVPADAILLGSVGSEVSWEAKVADLSPGETSGGLPNTVVVWTYNTTALDGAVERVETPFHAETQLAVEAAPSALEGERFPVNLTLTDGLGRPLSGRTVQVTWDAPEPSVTLTATTDSSGLAVFTLPEPRGTGSSTLTATFEGTDLLTGSQVLKRIPVRLPATLELGLNPTELTAGEAATATGRLLSPEGPVQGVAIQFDAGELTTNVTTAQDGSFELTIPVPPTAPSGPFAVLASFPGSDVVAPVETQASLDVLGTAFLKIPTNATLDQATGGLLRGHVFDGRDQGIRATVAFQASGLPTVESVAKDDGSWTLPIPPGLPRGTYAGDIVARPTEDHAGAARPFTLTIRSPGELTLDPLQEVVQRGTALALSGSLVDAQGKPVAGEGVIARLLGTTDQVVSASDGTFTATLDIPEDAPLGATTLQVSYLGSTGGTLTPVSVNRTLFVKAPTSLELTTEHTPLAKPQISGRLLDEQGQGVPGRQVTVGLQLPGRATPAAVTETTTSATGTFNASLPGHLAPQAVNATARLTFPGTTTLAAAEAAGPVNLTTPLVWDATLPDKLPMERAVSVQGTVRDAQGPAIEQGTVVALLDGEPVGSAPVNDGAFSLSIVVPKSVTVGSHELVVNLDPPGLHAATPLSRTVTVTTLATIEVKFEEALTAGETYRAIARVTDQAGRPLVNTTVIYWLTGAGQSAPPATARTNETGHAVLAGTTPATSGDVELTVVARGPQLTREAAVATAAPVGSPTSLSLLPAVLIAALAALLATAAYIIHRRRRQIGEVQDIVEELLHDLEMGNEYQAAVLLAYKRLQAHLETYGFLDKPDYTAREFLDAVGEAMPLPRDEVDDFVKLFEQARYSQHDVGPRHRIQAINKLRHIREAIEGRGTRRATP